MVCTYAVRIFLTAVSQSAAFFVTLVPSVLQSPPSPPVSARPRFLRLAPFCSECWRPSFLSAPDGRGVAWSCAGGAAVPAAAAAGLAGVPAAGGCAAAAVAGVTGVGGAALVGVAGTAATGVGGAAPVGVAVTVATGVEGAAAVDPPSAARAVPPREPSPRPSPWRSAAG
eukprot:8828534-Pyramimonas_sp.AAC.1